MAKACIPPQNVSIHPHSSCCNNTYERQAALAEKGIRLDAVLLHDNRRVARSHLPKQPFHRVLFSAGSTVHAYFEAFPDERHAPREWLAVGTSTLRALDALGLPARIVGG